MFVISKYYEWIYIEAIGLDLNRNILQLNNPLTPNNLFNLPLLHSKPRNLEISLGEDLT